MGLSRALTRAGLDSGFFLTKPTLWTSVKGEMEHNLLPLFLTCPHQASSAHLSYIRVLGT